MYVGKTVLNASRYLPMYIKGVDAIVTSVFEYT